VADVGDAFATEVDYILTLFEGALTYGDIMAMDRASLTSLRKARLESLKNRRKSAGSIDKIVDDYTKGIKKK